MIGDYMEIRELENKVKTLKSKVDEFWGLL